MIIIQLLKDTKYPANYQIIIDSSLGNYAVLRDFFSALHEDMVVHGLCGRVPDSAGNACSLNCRCSDIANLSAHLHRLPTPPPYLRRMRLPPGQGRRCWMANAAAGCSWHSSCKSPRTLQKRKCLITKQLTFSTALGELKLRPPRGPMCSRGA